MWITWNKLWITLSGGSFYCVYMWYDNQNVYTIYRRILWCILWRYLYIWHYLWCIFAILVHNSSTYTATLWRILLFLKTTIFTNVRQTWVRVSVFLHFTDYFIRHFINETKISLINFRGIESFTNDFGGFWGYFMTHCRFLGVFSSRILDFLCNIYIICGNFLVSFSVILGVGDMPW